MNIHPGSAKNQMKNGLDCRGVPTGCCHPGDSAHTEGYEGFYHLGAMEGNEELAILRYILRDHDSDKAQQKKENLARIAAYPPTANGARVLMQLKIETATGI